MSHKQLSTTSSRRGTDGGRLINENHAFAAKWLQRRGRIARYLSGLHVKFVTWRINRIFSSINELTPPYQPKFNGISRAVKTGNCVPLSAIHPSPPRDPGEGRAADGAVANVIAAATVR